MVLIAFWDVFGRRAFDSGPLGPVRTFDAPKTFQKAPPKGGTLSPSGQRRVVKAVAVYESLT
jgi:hypothetical protein